MNPAFLTPERRATLARFLRFATVGASGVPVDAAVVYALRSTAGLYVAGLAAYFVAATWTFALNRAWTFAGHNDAPLWQQWLRFLGANLSGFVLNRGTYMLLVTLVPLCAEHPVLAVGAGAIAGLFANFFATSRLVFR